MQFENKPLESNGLCLSSACLFLFRKRSHRFNEVLWTLQYRQFLSLDLACHFATSFLWPTHNISALKLLHSEWPKPHRVLAILSATGLKRLFRYQRTFVCSFYRQELPLDCECVSVLLLNIHGQQLWSWQDGQLN